MKPTTAIFVVPRIFGPAVLTLLTSFVANATLTTGVSAGGCNESGITHAECSYSFSDPAVGYGMVTGIADAEYGRLHVLATSFIGFSAGIAPTSLARASFSDTITLTPRKDAAVRSVRLFWSYQALDNGFVIRDIPPSVACSPPLPVICGTLYPSTDLVAENIFQIEGEVGVGDYTSFFSNHDFEASATLARIQLLGCQTNLEGVCDPFGMRPLTGFNYTSASGAAYNIEGATLVEEPASAFLITSALGILATIRKHFKRGVWLPAGI